MQEVHIQSPDVGTEVPGATQCSQKEIKGGDNALDFQNVFAGFQDGNRL